MGKFIKEPVKKMPIYEYKCKGCGKEFEAIVFSSDETCPCCPDCDCQDVDKLMSSGAIRANGIPTGSGGFNPPACRPSGGG